MNRPPKGDSYRKGQSSYVMFQPMAQDTPNMTVKINQGSFWVNNSTFVEYAGGSSPVIEAPSSGAKWTLIAINKLGAVILLNGLVMPNNPEPPEITKNILPIAFIYVKSSTKVITNDMIYDARPVFAAGGYPVKHNELLGREAVGCHTIDSITGLTEKLTDKLSVLDANNLLLGKADIDGTTSSEFVLNKDDTGVPVEYCGIKVHRGSLPEVGLRFNEDKDAWEFTNDGTSWKEFGSGSGTSANNLATDDTAGIVKLSVGASDVNNPIAVGTNDPRLAKIDTKADISQLASYVLNTDLDKKLADKVNKDDVYSKSDSATIFVTRAEYDNSGGYTKEQLNAMFGLKANASGVYTKEEIETKLSSIYTKAEVDALLANIHPGSSDDISKALLSYYTAKEVDALLQKVVEGLYSKDAVDAKFANVDTVVSNLNTKIDAKADIANVYTKTEVDSKISAITPSTIDMSNYYTKSETTLLLNNKAGLAHGHVAGDISQDSTHRFVTDDEITAWNKKADALTFTPENSANKGVANGYATLDSTGKIPTSQMPAMSVVGTGGVEVVENYANMTAITSPKDGQMVFVKDATGDTSVSKGWAQYMYSNSTWIKVAEQEGLDVVLDWNNVVNKPTTFTPDTTKLTGYAKTGTDGDVYTKTEVNNLLANKSDTTHNHDDVYVKASALATQLATKVDSTDNRLHAANTLGTYTVDESGVSDGMVLYYDGTDKKLKYKTVSSSGSITEDTYKLGSLTVTEPTAFVDGDVLTYDATSKKLTYRTISQTPTTSNKIGSVELDESSIGSGKVLTYNGTKVVYSALPANLLDIDDTNKKQGYVLSYNGNGKLEYIENKSSSSTTTSSGWLEYTVTATGGQTCLVHANKENAVTYTVSGNVAKLTFDVTAQIYSVQFKVLGTDIGSNTTLHVDMLNSDGKTYTWDNYTGAFPTINYFCVDGNYLNKTTSTVYDIDNPKTFEIRALPPSYPVMVKLTF